MYLNKCIFFCFPVVAVAPRDIIFLIDSTMGPAILGQLRDYIKQFVNSRPVGPNAVQVGVAQFSTAQRVVMDLNSYDTKEAIVIALDNIKPRPGQTVNIGAALNFVRENMLKPDSGSRIRSGITQIVMLWTSKKSSDNVDGPAEALLRTGVLTVAAGFKSASLEELNQIAISDKAVFHAKEFRQVMRRSREITDALSTLAGTIIVEEPTEPGNFWFCKAHLAVAAILNHQKLIRSLFVTLDKTDWVVIICYIQVQKHSEVTWFPTFHDRGE